MTGVDLTAVMDGLAAAVQTVLASDKHAYAFPVEDLTAGDAYVDFPTAPQPIAATFGRGLDHVTLTVVILTGLLQDKSSRDAMADHITGSSSAVSAIESHSTSAWSSAAVKTWEVGTYVPLNRPVLMALRLDVDILT